MKGPPPVVVDKKPVIIRSVSRMANWAARNGTVAGLVPTLGYLHEGHASLIKRARAENRFVAVSVFVNPLQFTAEGYRKYPRDLEADVRFAATAGADIVFAPDAAEMYPPHTEGEIVLPALFRAVADQNLEWHYRGVLVVVLKLLQIVRPRRIYFGLKDPHQLALIEAMVRRFNIPVAIRKCPTVREKDGLARSSRNALLDAAGRAAAPVLYRSLGVARKVFLSGKDPGAALAALRKTLAGEKTAHLEYCELVDPGTFRSPTKTSREALIFVAARIGPLRLTDNVRFQLP